MLFINPLTSLFNCYFDTKKKNKNLNKLNNLLVSQRMINAISCYYCSSKIHGNDCNDPFPTNKQLYLTTFNSSYRACAVINIIEIDFIVLFSLYSIENYFSNYLRRCDNSWPTNEM